MFFHEIAGELKPFMGPTERDGIFVVQLVGDTLREPMTEEEEKMAQDDKYNPMADLSLNMLDPIMQGSRFISKTRAELICSRFDGLNFADEIDNLYTADKEHLHNFLFNK